MRLLTSIIIVITLIVISSCRKDFSTVSSFGNLEFSKDTVFLDTIFTNIGSSTYDLKIYNRQNSTITIPKIQLENAENSNYRLNVDGIAGKAFDNIDILANDSIYIFIETTVDITSVPDPIYTDKILFDNGTNQQHVDLVTLVQDANFIFPDKNNIGVDSLIIATNAKIAGRFLTDDELTFTNEKPYVIYGYAAVPSGKTLTIEAGANIHFHNNSGLIIDNGATLIVNGTLDNKVNFQGDRLEHSFDRISGQWETIWLRAGSVNNIINHAIIKNGLIGLLIEGNENQNTPTLTIENSEIYNQTHYGLIGINTNINGANLVIGNAGQVSFAGTAGGNYNFTHCTFANYWNGSLRNLPSVLINNFFVSKDDDNQDVIEAYDLQAANFTNCIIDGNNNIEFILDRVEGTIFNYSITNSLIRFNDINNTYNDVSELNFTTSNYQSIILNGSADFKDVFNEEFLIGNNSDAINKALPSSIPMDLLGTDRTSNPDIGAYQHTSFEDTTLIERSF